MPDFRLPSLGAEMEDALVSHWLVHSGDVVRKGQALVVVETGKGAIELEGYEDGVVGAVLVAEGTRVPVGTPLARIETAALAPPATPPPAAANAAAGVLDPTAAERAATMRRTIAAVMARSKREIPHYYLARTIDLRPAEACLAAWNANRPVQERMLMVALLLRATALAARDVPEVNGFWRDEAFVAAAEVHLGVVIALRQGGMVNPTLRDCHARKAPDLMTDLQGISERARSAHLRGSDLTESTLTVTNLGDLGADLVHGVLYPPQVALVGFGRVALRPWVDAGTVVAAPCVQATLAADHRVSDGMTGSRFLAALATHLAHPEAL